METIQLYKSEPLTRQKIKNLAHSILKFLGLSEELYFPAPSILEKLHLFVPDAHYEILPTNQMEKHAETDVVSKTLYIREDVYIRACNGKGRDRMTIVHEFAHLILICVYGLKLYRTYGKRPRAYEDPEWQAKCLAGELMMNSNLIIGMTADEIVKNCGVSKDAAEFQLSRNKNDAPFFK